MSERDERLKFWIRGSESNPIGVINELQTRLGAPINYYGSEIGRFADPKIIWYIRNSWRCGLEIDSLHVDTDPAEWLMAAWPEIQPQATAPATIFTVVVKPKESLVKNCFECQFKDICKIEGKEVWNKIYPFPYLPCFNDIEVWENPEHAKESYGL